jgi:hypothetical protein
MRHAIRINGQSFSAYVEQLLVPIFSPPATSSLSPISAVSGFTPAKCAIYIRNGGYGFI